MDDLTLAENCSFADPSGMQVVFDDLTSELITTNSA